MDSTPNLFAVEGDPISASRHWNPLVKAVFKNTIQSSPTVRLHKLPNQVIVNCKNRGSAKIDHLFQIRASSVDANVEVRFGLGYVSGIQPIIKVQGKEVPISKIDDTTGDTPAVIAKSDHFRHGAAILYAEVTSDHAWVDQKVEMIALAEPPEPKPWTGYKVMGFLAGTVESFTVVPMVFFNVSHLVINRRSNGGGQHIWGLG